MAERPKGYNEKEGYILPSRVDDLMARLSTDKSLKSDGDRDNRTLFYFRQNPQLEDIVWETLYPDRDPKEKPLGYYFPLSLGLGKWKHSQQTLSVGFSNSLDVEITWDDNIHKVCGLRKKWMVPGGQNWTQYDSLHVPALLHEDPWIGKIDRRVLEAMDGYAKEDIENLAHMRGDLIALSTYPTRSTTIQLLYHFDIHGETESLRYLASRVLGEKGKVLNEAINHYLLYPNQVEEISVPGIGKYQFVANMPISRLMRNIFFPRQTRPRDSKDPSRESFMHGNWPNYWEISYVDPLQ